MATDIVVKQTGLEGSWHTVDIQTSFYLIFVILDSEVAPIQFPNCADWHSKHIYVVLTTLPGRMNAVLRGRGERDKLGTR